MCARESETISSLVMPGAVLMPMDPPFRAAAAGRPCLMRDLGRRRDRAVEVITAHGTRQDRAGGPVPDGPRCAPMPGGRRAAARSSARCRSPVPRHAEDRPRPTRRRPPPVVAQPDTEIRIARWSCQRRAAQPQRPVRLDRRRSRRPCARRRPRVARRVLEPDEDLVEHDVVEDPDARRRRRGRRRTAAPGRRSARSSPRRRSGRAIRSAAQIVNPRARRDDSATQL